MTTDYAVLLCARMGSQRLPGKALVSYCPDGETNLSQIVRRWKLSRRDPTLIVATSTDPADNAIAAWCAIHGLPCHRGSLSDVLGRMDEALTAFAPEAKFVARALADNPLVDVPLADWRLDVLADTGADGLWYAGDESRITYAGTTDVWSRAGWNKIVERSKDDEREHPGLHFWEHLNQYSLITLPLPPREFLYPIRTELDTPEDLKLFEFVFAEWGRHNDGYLPNLPTLWALDYLAAHPELVALNAGVELKTQTHANFKQSMNWTCEKCRARAGGLTAGDLVIHCPKCGSPKKFYAHKPTAKLARPPVAGA